uniref:Uncharacterized protein n=1 Tax=Hemiselmis tepida TaxID=464990 RepID=A0A7S0YEQ3_9CRYP|mmetsp:Transcript_10308/g.26717  ORF Transcript_10308/g.26717 Transcript_10308/m.26717 type:complete len:107 (+) Transcript_10308:48-368(+)|eukprot:CAMPEP_0174924596 /NCGR_PEP_ID=MMETSP1355-20121228/7344_1 /TAXON_ID=464990 /ORGANISM="Hemiselmis tepida, Strain CCMP443" /LENGTH=106 /DNA_ID=CAMNT_0016170415 /DNA_START=53 /DNA_END=373 /DNA_ORIENTATION=+
MASEAPARTPSGREISTQELEEQEAKAGVMEKDAAAVGTQVDPEKRKLGAFGRSGSSKQMIRQGSSSARRGSTPSTWMEGGTPIDPSQLGAAAAGPAAAQGEAEKK